MQNIAIIYNPRSGAGKRFPLQKIVDRLKMNACVFDLSQSNLDSILDRCRDEGFAIIAAAGGDGTVSAVASAIVRRRITTKLGIIPCGTLNHFARDLGIPIDPEKAFDTVIESHSTLIDMAKVNDRYFINTSSLGIYPYLIRIRNTFAKRGWGKWIAMIYAGVYVLRKLPAVSVEYAMGKKKRNRRSPFIFIGNNRYKFSGPELGSRDRIDQESLILSIAHTENRFKILRLAVSALRGRLPTERDFDIIGLREIMIASHRRKLLVSCDGEVLSMKPPLAYSIVPKALRVIIPNST